MATLDQIPTTPNTGAFTGRCWVMPLSDVDVGVAQINEAMRQRVVEPIGNTVILTQTGLILLDRQILVILTHGGQANLFVCDSMEVNQ